MTTLGRQGNSARAAALLTDKYYLVFVHNHRTNLSPDPGILDHFVPGRRDSHFLCPTVRKALRNPRARNLGILNWRSIYRPDTLRRLALCGSHDFCWYD